MDVTKGGIVYPFTGLRGDAKELYRTLALGKENRVELIRADNIAEQRPHCKVATIIIFATGY